MNGKDLNGIVDNMGTLVIDQSEWTEPSENEFINELSYDCSHVGP
jgi:hypothetical protein